MEKLKEHKKTYEIPIRIRYEIDKLDHFLRNLRKAKYDTARHPSTDCLFSLKAKRISSCPSQMLSTTQLLRWLCSLQLASGITKFIEFKKCHKHNHFPSLRSTGSVSIQNKTRKTSNQQEFFKERILKNVPTFQRKKNNNKPASTEY